MDIQITHQVTEFDKEELLTGLRSYNAQFVDFSKNGQLGVYCRNESGEMVGGLIADRKGPWLLRRGDLFKITVIRRDLTEFVVIQGDRRKHLSR